MKKLITFLSFFALGQVAFAQTSDYRTTEDGINKLLSNPEFVNDVIDMGTTDFSLEKLDTYFTKYVPEYSNFKIGTGTIDANKIYYANAEGASTDKLADLLGNSLKLNPAETQNLKNAFSGNLNYTPTSNLSTGLSSQLYERGKNAKVDYTIDYAVDFFQNELGDGGVNSALIDIGGGLLGNLSLALHKREQEKMAEAARLERLSKDMTVYKFGANTGVEGNIYVGTKTVDKTAAEQNDLQTHFKAEQLMFNGVGGNDYKKAIKLLDEAIVNYKKNPDRAYYLYRAYIDRALCKMQMNAHRPAIVDYYFAQKMLESILNKKLPDNSITSVLVDGKLVTTVGTLNKKDLASIVLYRAFAKYRAKDYTGARADADLVIKTLVNNNISSSGKPNDFKDLAGALIAMSEFGLSHYKASYDAFLNANLKLEGDKDFDGVLDFMDHTYMGIASGPQIENESIYFYCLPNYFVYDIIQIKGLSYYKAGKISDAINMYENIVTAEQGKSGENFKFFSKAGGDISSVYATLGSYYHTKGDKEKAISLLDNAIKLNPNQLEYYYKRGTYKKQSNKIKEAEEDFKIVKNPESLKTNIKTYDYYSTEYTRFNAANNRQEEFRIIKEAIAAYPDCEVCYNWAIKNLETTLNRENANELSEQATKNTKMYHVLRSLYHKLSADTQKEEEEMMLAFENGLGFYPASTFYSLNLRGKPYYSKLLSKYMSTTNNNFIPQDFNQEQKERMKKTLDSTYLVLNKQYENVKGMKDQMENLQKEQLAKSLGEYQTYLEMLESKKAVLNMSPILSLEKIECLFILNRKEEAIKYAQKVFSKGKLTKPMDETLYPGSKLTNGYYYAIENIAKGAGN